MIPFGSFNGQREAAEAMQEAGANACTDVTGFGLLGHVLEMASASDVCVELDCHRVPLIPGARELAAMGMIPAGSFANRDFCDRAVVVRGKVDPLLVDLLADAQTSGGLLIAVAAERAEGLHAALERRSVPHPEIGRVTAASEARIVLQP